ncbi:hypothetical protein [Billgrantia antri]|uniref:Uncharacterized protein n=1 Tax=Billgrantia antri TaxID=2846777 RepID=A0ABS6ZRI4_9GAMM|nr:hypothetical protein [Halomonas antri]MBW6392703.1 hypothetical protein [Halomonas antri]
MFGSRTQRDEVSRTRAIGSEVTTGGDLLVASGLDQTYQAARLRILACENSRTRYSHEISKC